MRLSPAWQKGEISAALARLDRWQTMEQDAPDTDPARVLSCQSFYKQVRSEDEAVRNSLEQARKMLADQDFTGALQICDQYLAKYPNHALFQALRFDIEERRRKSLSAFIAETDRRAENEQDLEKRCSILEEAAQLHPGEPHFERALRLARDKRNLVNSVVQKARTQEEQGRFPEALDTWEMLRAIYSKYPGLDHEVARLVKRRDSAARNDAQAAWVERIDKLLEGREFEKAATLAQTALAEFPDDPELREQEKLACKHIANCAEAEAMLHAGRQACLAGKHDEGLQLMRAAVDLDPGDPVLCATVLDALVERAGELKTQDPRGSEALISEVLDRDPGNPAALNLRKEREAAQRSEFVYWCTAQAQRLQANGSLEGALAVVHDGLTTWPQEYQPAANGGNVAACLERCTTDGSAANNRTRARSFVTCGFGSSRRTFRSHARSDSGDAHCNHWRRGTLADSICRHRWRIWHAIRRPAGGEAPGVAGFRKRPGKTSAQTPAYVAGRTGGWNWDHRAGLRRAVYVQSHGNGAEAGSRGDGPG